VSTGTSVEFGKVSIILKRSDAGEAVFTEHRRGQVIFVVPFAILCVPGTFIFFLLPDSGGLGTDILMSVISVAMLSMVVGVAVSEALKHRNRLTVTSEAITFVRWSDGRETALRRGDGDRLLIIPNNLGAVLPRDRILTQLGAGRVIGLNGFSAASSDGRIIERGRPRTTRTGGQPMPTASRTRPSGHSRRWRRLRRRTPPA
jgi:hypothetical protein